MKIKFIAKPIGRPEYVVGRSYDFNGSIEEGYARKYIDRGWAEDITPKVSHATVQEIKTDSAADAARIESERLQQEADRLKALGEIKIPANWAELPWPELKALADSVSDEPIKSKVDAAAAIEAELKRRTPA